MAQSDSIQSKTDLHDRIAALTGGKLRECLQWLMLSDDGNAAAQRDRLRGCATGPSKRHRAGWLQLALDCTLDGDGDDCAVPGADFLFELKERLDSLGLLPSMLPLSLLPDLIRIIVPSEGEGDEVEFSLPPGFKYPSISAVSSLVGATTDDVSSLRDELALLKSSATFASSASDTDDLLARLREGLALDVAEHRFSVGAGSSIAVQRRALAFDFDAENFRLYDYKLQDSGRGRDLVSGTVNQDWMRTQLFDSQITGDDLKKMDKRSMVPEEFWTQAYSRTPEKTLIMGGEQSAAFKADDNLRIQQQAVLKKCQHSVHVLSAISRSHNSLEFVLLSSGPGGHMPVSTADIHGFTYEEANVYYDSESDQNLIECPGRNVLHKAELEALRASRAAAEEALFAAADSFHLFAAELSELERKRDDEYVRARSGNDKFTKTRPSSDVTVYDKDMSELDVIADKELLRQKNLQALKKDFRKPHLKPSPRGGKGGKGGKGKSQQDRQAQSKRDKAQAAKNRASRPEPQDKGPKKPVPVDYIKKERK